jgi:hypothetical protein
MGARLSLLFLAGLALAPSGALLAHSGYINRSGFEPSDAGLFVCAATGIWFARRSMRARARAKRPKD